MESDLYDITSRVHMTMLEVNERIKRLKLNRLANDPTAEIPSDVRRAIHMFLATEKQQTADDLTEALKVNKLEFEFQTTEGKPDISFEDGKININVDERDFKIVIKKIVYEG